MPQPCCCLYELCIDLSVCVFVCLCVCLSQDLCVVTCLKDLTSVVDIKTSSRPAMIGSLTDGSTETFWESGDEDKNKTKTVTISCVKGLHASNVSVHVDNSRDIGVSPPPPHG